MKTKTLPSIIYDGMIAAPVDKAAKSHKCHECKGEIYIGSTYFKIIYAGGGVQPYPHRVHPNCLAGYLGCWNILKIGVGK
ncbi:hypothetical protein ACFLXT_02640 [Chloroflexota bacterium]